MTAIGAGGHHSLARTSAGVAWAWEQNEHGQLGDGSFTPRLEPVQVEGLSGVSGLGGGVYHSLALVGTGPTSQTLTYGYDKLYRLTSASGPAGTTTYTYDPVGNRLSRTRGGTTASSAYDRADRVSEVDEGGAVAYTVNANGNLTARGSDSFGYDQANRLTSATVNGTSSSAAYDGDGKRASQTVGAVTTRYVYDTNKCLPRLLEDGTRKYVWGLGLACAVSGSTIEVYHSDGLGSVRALTNGSGVVTDSYQTDEFGIPTATSGGSGQPFGYTGEQGDDETELVYLRARMYDPATGRFVQRDTRCGNGVAPVTLYRFTYVHNNPVNQTDPSGHVPRDPFAPECPAFYECVDLCILGAVGARNIAAVVINDCYNVCTENAPRSFISVRCLRCLVAYTIPFGVTQTRCALSCSYAWSNCGGGDIIIRPSKPRIIAD